ncbi:MAG: EAL domain-containing protein [Legionella sp.]
MKSNDLLNENYWKNIIDALSEPIIILDSSSKILYANKASCSLFNKKFNDIIGSDFSYPIEIEKPTNIEILGANNKVLNVEVYMREATWKNYPVCVATLNNSTERLEREHKLNILANVFNFAKEGVLVTDSHLNIIDVNLEFTNITQYTKEEVIGKTPNILKSKIQGAEFYKKMWLQLNNEGYWYGEIWNKKKNNEIYPQLLAITQIKDPDGHVVNYLGVFYDVTQQEIQRKQIAHLAYYDSLTNLPNRRLLMDRIEVSMKKAQHFDNFIALFFINIDNFKSINDLYRHKTGDKVLKKTAHLLCNSIRGIDTLARLGGDEFVILLEGLLHPSDYKVVIDAIYKKLTQPLLVDSHKITINISAGVSIFPQKTSISSAALLSQADQAMYKSKTTGKNRYFLFDEELDLQIRRQESLINDIKSSFKNNQLKLYYQPKVNMKTGKILGVEGLIRWEHPQRGLLLPNQFLPQMQNDASFPELLAFTLRTALEQIQLWNSLDDALTISVNISALQLEQEHFFDKLMNIVKPYPKKIYSRLELEILESSIITKFKSTAEIIKKCNEIGINFSLDDFGTKSSSINYLVKLPFTYMKIDADFIKNITIKERDSKIFRAILDIAKAINILVIAEGVATEEHINYLIDLGCDLGQGFAIGKPMLAEKFPEWYKAWKSKTPH